MINRDNDFKKDPLGGFINFINSKNDIKQQDTVLRRRVTFNQNRILFQISSGALIAGPQSVPFLTLKGNLLRVKNSSINLSQAEMDILYSFIDIRNRDGSIKYFVAEDITINDGGFYDVFIDWNKITFNEHGGHTMPLGILQIIDYCERLINK